MIHELRIKPIAGDEKRVTILVLPGDRSYCLAANFRVETNEPIDMRTYRGQGATLLGVEFHFGNPEGQNECKFLPVGRCDTSETFDAGDLLKMIQDEGLSAVSSKLDEMATLLMSDEEVEIDIQP